jgi:hypothetical protein
LRERYDEFQKAGLPVLAVSMGTPLDLTEFLAEHDLPFELLCDPSAEAYRAYGLVRGNAYQVAMAPQVVAAGIKAAAEGHFISATVGDAMQLPGSFVVVDGRIVYAHRGRLSSDLAPIDDLLQAVRQAT